MTKLPAADFDEWWKATFADRRCRHEPIGIAGDFRRGDRRNEIDLVELGGRDADTVRILVPRSTPVPSNGHKPTSCEFSARDDNGWLNGWASVLVAATLSAPAVDPVRLADLVHDPRRIRFCCDTNALAGGVVPWLLTFLGHRADIVTSAVVDRELAAWPDRHSTDFWQAKTADAWSMRTQYRLARRLIEAPPRGIVVDRLSPEQGALMLAKLRDEQRQAKSPDADVLLVELARSLVRDQPRNARVVFLTGDRNNARTATGALGAENVLYAAADSDRVHSSLGTIVARGAWRPEGPLGAVHVPPVGGLVWDLLAPCARLIVHAGTKRWEIAQCMTLRDGVPSDWAEPWLEVRELPSQTSTAGLGLSENTLATPTAAPTTQAALEGVDDLQKSEVRASFLRLLRLRASLQPEGPILASPPSVPPSATIPVQQEAHSGTKEWLLPPVEVGPMLDLPPGIRPSPGMIFPVLVKALGGGDELDTHKHSDATLDEARRILSALGATDAAGRPGPRADAFRAAWIRQDHDWFHAELKRLPGYVAALAFVKANPGAPRTSRQDAHVSMARALGQIARLDKIGGALVLGDAPLTKSELVDALDRWLPRPGATLGTTELCRLAGSDLFLTPARFERAMELLWAAGLGVQFEGRTGGTVVPGFAEKVIALGAVAARFRAVAPGDLSFGRSGPVRFVTRVR